VRVFGGFPAASGKEERERLALAYSVEPPGQAAERYGLRGGSRSPCPALPFSPDTGHGGHVEDTPSPAAII